MALRHPGAQHVTLYRGVNRMDDHEVLGKGAGGRHIILLNNLSSFTCSRERAGEFGDYILSTLRDPKLDQRWQQYIFS